MKLVGAIPAPATPYGPKEYVVYRAAAWGLTDRGLIAFPVRYYGVVQSEGDDAPGCLIPMVRDPDETRNPFILVPANEVASILRIVEAESEQDALDAVEMNYVA